MEEAVGRWILGKEIKPETDLKYAFIDGNDRIGTGEKQALKLCRQLDASILLADDKEARRVARLLRGEPVGACGILLQAHRKGLASIHETHRKSNDLVEARFRLETTLYRRVLDELGRTETRKRTTK